MTPEAPAPDWTPLRGEPWEEEAHDVLDELAQAVSHAEAGRLGLAGGAPGMALFLAYYGGAREDDAAEARAAELLEAACDELGGTPLGPDLYAGWTGIAWAIEHLAGAEEGEEDPNEDVDKTLASLVERSPWPGQYDLVSGLCGMAVYAFERLPSPAAARSLEQIVGRLDELSVPGRVGRTWHTPAEHLPPWQREMAPEGYYNLGIAHGVPAIVSILARSLAAGIAEKQASRLLEGAVEWLFSQQIRGKGARYAAWRSEAPPSEPTRTAWCYGDPGVALSLLSAGRAAGEPVWEREALDIARGAARRAAGECGVRDGGLCHGAFGLAHLFLRFYHASGDTEFRKAASAWIGRGLALREPGRGIAGFSAYQPDGSPRAEVGFLEGISGIGLSLLSALSDIEPEWDRILLADLP